MPNSIFSLLGLIVSILTCFSNVASPIITLARQNPVGASSGVAVRKL